MRPSSQPNVAQSGEQTKIPMSAEPNKHTSDRSHGGTLQKEERAYAR